ncbi:MAG: tetratricopeptide repeat protein, partial [Egibacteraceae bacterium]
MEQADAAIEEAIARASADAATLYLAWIGHGEYAEDDFYLLPADAGWPPDSQRAVLVAKRVQELLRRHDHLDGLVLLVDACHSGLGALQAAAQWPATIAKAGGRFEVLTSADERTAADGCFTAALTELLWSGQPRLGESLRCAEVQPLLQRRCAGRADTVHAAFVNGRRLAEGDEGLWLARNAARRSAAPLAGTPAWGQVERLTAWFQPTPQLEELVDASRSARCLALVGVAGAGKSTLAAALARAELADDLIPARFVHGLVFAAPATSAADLAGDLHRQLTVTVPGFAAAAVAFQRRTPEQVWRQLDAFAREVIGPLGLLEPERPVRIVVDGLDQLSAEAAPGVLAALQALADDPDPRRVRLVVTARPDTPLPAEHHRQDLDHVRDIFVGRYLSRRQVPDSRRAAIIQRAAGNWLVARLLADLVADVEAAELPATLHEAYRSELVRVGADRRGEWEHTLRPVLSALAVAGVGPVLPLPLLCRASGLLGGPDKPARVRDALVRLRGLVVRGNPGTPDEHAGVFHDTLAGYLLSGGDFDVDTRGAHQALADAIADLAPATEHTLADPLHRYATTAEAEHLWALDRHGPALTSVNARQSHVPAENLARWRGWHDRAEATLGPDHPDSLTTRPHIARWTGETGDAAEALRLSQALLPDCERLLGPDHPNTLTTRAGIAFWTGEAGDAAEALRLHRALLPDCERLLGPDHPNTLATRAGIAFWTGEAGDAAEALRLYRALLPDCERL